MNSSKRAPSAVPAFPCDRLSSDPHAFLEAGDTGGGLSINLGGKGTSDGSGCRFDGFYMNEPVFGMHQGVIETYFAPIDETRILASGAYCLMRGVSSQRFEGIIRKDFLRKLRRGAARSARMRP